MTWFPSDLIAWWQCLFLVLALLVWPALYILSCFRLARGRRHSVAFHLANCAIYAAVGSWLLTLGLPFVPIVAALCTMFSVFLSVAALILAAVACYLRPENTQQCK